VSNPVYEIPFGGGDGEQGLGFLPPSARAAAAASHASTGYAAAEYAAAATEPFAGYSFAESSQGADPDLTAALEQVVQSGASDLHISGDSAPLLRIDGALRPAPGTSVWSRAKVHAAITSIMSQGQQDAFAADLELDFAYTHSAAARFRVNVYQQRGAVGAAFRLIPSLIKPLNELGTPESIGRFTTLARGLVLVTGPTGSGKSTTLAALVDRVNETRTDHIVTVEDPIEFLHENKRSLVNQREVGNDTHSFTAALRHVLRQDPDVILIGELRDLETISIALTAAETGHLVFATLHTQDAPQTIDRIIDVFPPHQQAQIRSQLASTLQGVISQTLIKSASGSGRIVATEVLVMTPAIANLIREGKIYQIRTSLQAGRELGMHTMDQHLADLVKTGRITHEAALEKAHDAQGFGQLVMNSSNDFGGRSTAPSF
jgi:twitching motility protein PilT